MTAVSANHANSTHTGGTCMHYWVTAAQDQSALLTGDATGNNTACY